MYEQHITYRMIVVVGKASEAVDVDDDKKVVNDVERMKGIHGCGWGKESNRNRDLNDFQLITSTK